MALLPGIGVLFGIIKIPDTAERLVGAVSFPLSIVIVLAIILLSPSIRKLSAKAATLIAIVAVLLGAATATSYYFFAERYVIPIDHVVPVKDQPDSYQVVQSRIILPYEPSEAMANILRDGVPENHPWNTSSNYRNIIQTTPAGGDMLDSIEEQNNGSTLAVIVLLILSQLLLTMPIVFIAWRVVGGTDAPAPAGRAPRRRNRRRSPGVRGAAVPQPAPDLPAGPIP